MKHSHQGNIERDLSELLRCDPCFIKEIHVFLIN